MDILTFINKFKEAKIQNSKLNEHAVSDYLKNELEIKEYVPFEEKRELCEKVLNACNTRRYGSRLVEVDSISRYLLFTIAILSKYTNIEFSTGEGQINSIAEYDMLCQNGLLNPILEVIGGEYDTCNNMLNMMMDDIIVNNNTIENVLDGAADRLLDSIDDFIGILADKVESLNSDLNQIDIDKYEGLIKKIVNK